MASAGKVEVEIIANASKWVQEMRGVNRSVTRLQRQFRAFARVATSAFAFFGGGSLVRDILNTANALEDFATRLGISSQELQAWQLIAERSGIAANQFNLAIQRVTRRSAEAALGFGEAQDALRTLRIDAEAFSQADLDDQVLALAEAFGEVEDKARRTQLAFKLFDSEGVAFLQLLSEGEEGLRKLRDELEDQVWSDEEIKRMADANKALETMAQNIKLVSGELVASGVAASKSFFQSDTVQSLLAFFETLKTVVTGGDFFANAPPGSGVLRPDFLPSTGGGGGGGGGRTSDLRGITAPQPGTVGPFDLGPAPGTTTGAGGTDAFGERLQTATEFYNQWLDEQQRLYASAQDQLTEINRNGVMARMEDEERFVSMFTTNMVQAADSGFASILDSWKRTLLQMFLETINSQLFNALGGTGFGSAIFGALGIGGGASGITAAVTDAQRRGTL